MTSLKNNYFKISVVCGIAIIASLIVFQNFNSCPAKQFSLIDDITKYEQTYDPNMCLAIAEKIEQINSECGSGLELPDCG